MKKLSDLKLEWLNKQIEKLTANGKSKAEIARDLEIKPQYLNLIQTGIRGLTDNIIDKFRETYKIYHFDISDGDSQDKEQDSGSNQTVETLKSLLKDKDKRIEDLCVENGRLKEKINHESTKKSMSGIMPDQ